MRHTATGIFFASLLLSCAYSYGQDTDGTSRSKGSPPLPIEETNVAFRNEAVRLAGTLVFPNTDTPTPALIVLHSASGASRDYHVYDHLRQLLPRLGIAVLVFDRRGHGGSSGDFQTASFDDLASDALAALDLLAALPHIDERRIGLWGVSQGGWIATRAASKSKRVAFVISVSGPGVSPAEQMIYSAETSLRIEGYSEDVVQRAATLRRRVDEYYRGNADRLSVQHDIDDARDAPWFEHVYLPNRGHLPGDVASSKWFQEMDYDPLSSLTDITVPMLFLFGALDRWVPVTTSIKKIETATASKPSVNILSIGGADHYLTLPDSLEEDSRNQRLSPEYLRVLREWLQEHVKVGEDVSSSVRKAP